MLLLADDSATLLELVRIVGPLGGFLILLVISLILLWRFVLSQFLDKVVVIVGSLRDVTTSTERTAGVLKELVDDISPHKHKDE